MGSFNVLSGSASQPNGSIAVPSEIVEYIPHFPASRVLIMILNCAAIPIRSPDFTSVFPFTKRVLKRYHNFYTYIKVEE